MLLTCIFMQLMKDLTKEKKKAKEQAKDPNKPKKPLSSYLIFRFSIILCELKVLGNGTLILEAICWVRFPPEYEYHDLFFLLFCLVSVNFV